MTSPRIDCPTDVELPELLIADDPAPAADCPMGISRTGTDVTPAGLAMAKARSARRELTESSFFAVDPGFAVSSAQSWVTSKKATAMAAIIRATNFIVGSSLGPRDAPT